MMLKWYHIILTQVLLSFWSSNLILWRSWLNHFGMSWCSSLSGGVRSNTATPLSDSLTLQARIIPHLRRMLLHYYQAEIFLVFCKGICELKDQSCTRNVHTSPSVQSSMIIQTGFSVITPMSFTMWGWSNWRIVTESKRNKLVVYKKNPWTLLFIVVQ